MSIITRMRRQFAVYWERSANPDEFGRYTFEEPVEIECRWDDASVEFRDSQGQKVLSKSIAYVDRNMKIGDFLKEGEMSSNEVSDPTEDDSAFEIQRCDRNPNIKATETLRTCYM